MLQINLNEAFQKWGKEPYPTITEQRSITEYTVPPEPDFSKIFDAGIITSLLDLTECIGIRFYPCIRNNSPAMIARGVGMDYIKNGVYDLKGASDNCCIAYVENNQARSESISADDAEALIVASEESLNIPATGFRKAFFDKDFLTEQLEIVGNNQIVFEIVNLNYEEEGTPKEQQTIAIRTINANSEEGLHASLLPCPPNCGGGVYGQ